MQGLGLVPDTWLGAFSVTATHSILRWEDGVWIMFGEVFVDYSMINRAFDMYLSLTRFESVDMRCEIGCY